MATETGINAMRRDRKHPAFVSNAAAIDKNNYFSMLVIFRESHNTYRDLPVYLMLANNSSLGRLRYMQAH